VTFWISPVEFNVVIEPDRIESGKTKGGIILPDEVKENKDAAMMMGTLLAVSPLAFNYDTWPEEHMAKRPKPGDRVLYAKFAGTVVQQPITGTEYRVCKDKDIIAVIPEGGSND
jgi:co-chaperonin GroES (HSP10)